MFLANFSDGVSSLKVILKERQEKHRAGKELPLSDIQFQHQISREIEEKIDVPAEKFAIRNH